MANLNPFSWLAWVLDIRCHNCGLQTTSLLIDNCTRCGYPVKPKYECSSCGLKTARTKKGKCPKCGSALIDLQSKPPVTEPVPETPEVKPEPPSETPAAEEKKAEETALVPAPPEPVAVIETTPTAVAAVKPDEPTKPVPPPEPTVIVPPPLVIILPTPALKEIPVFEEEFGVSVEQVSGIFNADRVKADATYKGKMLRIKGVVERVSTTDMADIYLILGSAKSSTTKKVKCIFPEKYLATLGRMTIGQKVAILGKYDGDTGDLQMTDCMPVG